MKSPYYTEMSLLGSPAHYQDHSAGAKKGKLVQAEIGRQKRDWLSKALILSDTSVIKLRVFVSEKT